MDLRKIVMSSSTVKAFTVLVSAGFEPRTSCTFVKRTTSTPTSKVNFAGKTCQHNEIPLLSDAKFNGIL